MDRWCQNKRCCAKKNQGQIRGKKGFKYYQSHKASRYYGGYWCSMGCREEWFQVNATACMNAVGFIDKQTLPLEDAWYVEYNWSWNHGTSDGYYELRNKLKGVRQAITNEQAQTPEQLASNNYWRHIDDIQAKELAVKLGLAS